MGEAVWAKIKYNPYWPGCIVDTPKHIKQPPRKFCVFFFGTNNYGFVDLENTHSYWEFKEKYTKKGRGKMFQEAVIQCEKFINDSTKFVLPNNEINVAKEFGFQIKKEPAEGEAWYSNEKFKRCTECDIKEELLKNAEKYKLEIKKIHSEEKVKLQSEIDRLIVENNKATMQLDCYRKNEFEVESLLAHKIVRGKQTFLVRWKHFDSTEDSWVRREHLNCPVLLEEYSKANNLS